MSTPARTASLHKSDHISRPNSFARRGVRAALLAACGAVLVAGCNQVGSGLNSNLPPAGGGGLLSFTSVAMPDGIAGRAYSKVAVTSVETQAKTNFPISPAVASGTAPLASCTVSSGTLPPGMNAALTVDPTGAGCVISGTPSAAAAGNTYQFTIQALDSNSPPRAAAQTFTMKVRPEFTVTPPAAIVGGLLPAGVQGRTYGQIAGNAAAMTATTNLSATTGNGAVGAKDYCTLSVTPALASLALTQVAGTNNCQLQGSAALAAAGSYKVTVAVTDNPIVDPETNLAVVPANTIAAASNATLNVAAPLKIVAADTVSATPPAAVVGRAYGTGSGCTGGACSPLTYASSGGLPSVEPADSYLFSNSAALTAAGINCAATASSTIAKTTCSGTPSTASTANFSVTVDDPGNLATPSGSASATTASVSGLSLTVDSALSLAVNPDPAANPAVQNRAYGTGTGCTGTGGACAAPTYTPSGGLGAYSVSLVSGAPPAGIACASNAGTFSCSGTPTATGPSTFGVSASDAANASTPSATTATVSKTLTVDGALTLTPPASLPPAVNGRAFGTGGGCSGGNCVPAAFTISGGLGAYSASASVVSAPGTWTCPLVGSTYNCSSAAVVSGTPNLSITASDGANATTPGATTASASTAITVVSEMAVTPIGGSGAAPDAVTQSAYGQGANCAGGLACAPLQYSIAGGLGNYQTGSLAVGTGAPDTLTCTVAASIYSCSTPTINGGAVSGATLRMTAVESGDASTPGRSAALDATRTLTIQPALTISQVLGTAWPDAVNGRTYGTGNNCGAGGASACEAAQFTANGGVGSYTFSKTNFPLTFTCSGSPTYSCSSANVTSAAGVFHPQVTVQDAGNTATPSVSVSTPITTTLNVDGVLTLQPPTGTPATAVNGRGYGSNGTVSNTCSGPTACLSLNFPVSGGLGSPSATIVTAPGSWSCPLVGTNYECATASVADAGPFPHLNVPVTLTASDTANPTTPSATTSQATANVTINAALQFLSSPTLPLADGVTNRSYGVGSGCIPISACAGLTYTDTGGIAPVFSSSGFPPGLNCVPSSSTYSCTASPITGAPNSYSLQVNLSDSGNASTPAAATVTSPSATLVVRAQLSLSVNPDPATNSAVQGRDYGVTSDSGCSSGSCLALTYTPAGGLQDNYTITQPVGTPPTGILCTPSSQGTPSATLSCGGPAISGSTSTFSVTVVDTANQSTPAATVGTDPQSTLPKTLTVNSALAFTPPTLPNALVGYPYPTVNGATTPTSPSGGLPGYTWVEPGTSGCTGTTPPSWISLNAVTGALSGTPSTPGASVALSICLSDTPNLTTPIGALAENLNMAIIDTLAYAAEPNANQIEVINTTSNTVVGSAISTGSGSIPVSVALSPSSRFAFVTLAGTGKLAVIDTTSSAQITNSPISLSGCTAAQGIAATSARIFIACSGSHSVVVLDYSALSASSPDASAITALTSIDTGTGTGPESVAIRPDGARVYVTLESTNELFVISNPAGTPIELSGGGITNPFPLQTTVGTVPVGIVVVPNSSDGTLAYIGKQAGTSSNDGVEVVSGLDSDAFSTLTSINVSSATASPQFVAVTPDNSRVYLSLTDANQFAIIDNANTVVTPALGPIVSLGLNAAPNQITIPPLSSGTLRVYISLSGTQSGVGVVDNSSPTPALDAASPIVLTSGPNGIGSVPAPK